MSPLMKPVIPILESVPLSDGSGTLDSLGGIGRAFVKLLSPSDPHSRAFSVVVELRDERDQRLRFESKVYPVALFPHDVEIVEQVNQVPDQAQLVLERISIELEPNQVLQTSQGQSFYPPGRIRSHVCCDFFCTLVEGNGVLEVVSVIRGLENEDEDAAQDLIVRHTMDIGTFLSPEDPNSIGPVVQPIDRFSEKDIQLPKVPIAYVKRK